MRMLSSTDAEDDLAKLLVDALGEDMAFALDTPGAIMDGDRPLAEFVRHRDIRGKRRRFKISVTMENA